MPVTSSNAAHLYGALKNAKNHQVAHTSQNNGEIVLARKLLYESQFYRYMVGTISTIDT